MQIVLMAIGGVLIIYGALRATLYSTYEDGYDAFWKGDYDKAIEAFDKNLERNPKSIEAKLGLVLSHLGKGDLDRAEKTWDELAAPDAALPGGVSPLKQWRSQHSRDYLRFEGELLYAQAWLTAEELLRAYRQELPEVSLEEYRVRHLSYMSSFREFVEEHDPEDSKIVGRLSRWAERYRELDTRIRDGQRIDDVLAALRLMKSNSRNPDDEDTPTLLAMLDPHLDRGLKETPDSLRVYTWRLGVFTVLAARKVTLPDGRKANDALGESVAAVIALMERTPPETDAPDETRFHAFFALALIESSKNAETEAAGAFRKHADDALNDARAWFAKVPDDHYLRDELGKLIERTTLRLAEANSASHGG